VGPNEARRPEMGRLLLGFLALAGSQAPLQPLTLREETCRACYRSCPISCFAGTCGLSYGASVNRFGTTNSCWTCDQSASVGISRTGDYAICTPEESAATDSYVKKKDPIKPPWGSAVPGDAKAAAQKAADKANEAMAAAQEAAAESEKAAQAAVAKFNKAAGQDKGDKQELAEAHRLAETIRANEAEQAARASEEARKQAENQYQADLTKLREQEVRTEHSEDALARAEKAAEDARAGAKDAAARAAEAARAAADAGAAAAGQQAEQAEADELAAAARAAQRRAIMAAVAAKGAADKASMAGAIATTPAQAPILLHKSSVQSTGPADPAAAAGPVAALRAAAKREAALVPAPGGAAAAPAAASAAEAVAEAATPEAAQTDPLLGASAPSALPPLDTSLPPLDTSLPPLAPEASGAPGTPIAGASLVSGKSVQAQQPQTMDAPGTNAENSATPEAATDVSPLMPTLLPMPEGADPNDESARMANAVVAEVSMDPSVAEGTTEPVEYSPSVGFTTIPVSPYAGLPPPAESTPSDDADASEAPPGSLSYPNVGTATSLGLEPEPPALLQRARYPRRLRAQ